MRAETGLENNGVQLVIIVYLVYILQRHLKSFIFFLMNIFN